MIAAAVHHSLRARNVLITKYSEILFIVQFNQRFLDPFQIYSGQLHMLICHASEYQTEQVTGNVFLALPGWIVCLDNKAFPGQC